MWSTKRSDGPRRGAWRRAILAIGLTLVVAGCGPGGAGSSTSGTLAPTGASPPSATTSPTGQAGQAVGAGAEEVLSIASNTQAHLGQVAIGAGNFWEEEYAPPDGAARRGLTAGLWLTFRDDPAQNRHLRVHPGQEIAVPGYRLRVLAVEPRTVQVAVRREP